MADHSETTTSARRQNAVKALAILDTPKDPAYDAVMRLMRRNLHAPIAALSILDGDRCFIKSEAGLNKREITSEQALCAAVVQSEGILCIDDASKKDEFKDHPLVSDAPQIKSFLGCPVRAPDRTVVGCLAVYTTELRAFTDQDQQVLQDMGLLVERMMASRAPSSDDPLRALLQRRSSDTANVKGAASRVPISLLIIKTETPDDMPVVNEVSAERTNDIIFQQCRRAGDFVARSQSDEYFAMLPNTDANGAQTIAERIQKALLNSNLPGCHRIVIGGAIVSTAQAFAKGWSAWSDVADNALIKAMKNDGPTAYVAEQV